MSGTGGTKTRKKIGRDEFLELALQHLVQKGEARLHLNALIDALPVTSGSFYHHFRDKREFLIAVISYWDKTHTQGIIDELENLADSASAQDRLWFLITSIELRKLTQWDRIIRAISVGDAELDALVGEVDQKRQAVVQSLFEDLGFRGRELLMRTRVFVIAMSQEDALRISLPKAQRERYLKELHAFFIRT